MKVPTEYKYTKNHEWLNIKDGVAYIGVTDYAQSKFGDAVFVELPAENDEFHAGDSFAVIESVKTVSDIYMPISGKIRKANMALEDSPELINQDPYGDAWIAQVELSDSKEIENLLDSAAYETLISKAAEDGD